MELIESHFIERRLLILSQSNNSSCFLFIDEIIHSFSFSFYLALLDLRISLAQYIQSFDKSFGQSLLPKDTFL